MNTGAFQNLFKLKLDSDNWPDKNDPSTDKSFSQQQITRQD